MGFTKIVKLMDVCPIRLSVKVHGLTFKKKKIHDTCRVLEEFKEN
jgi:hypothetical protein